MTLAPHLFISSSDGCLYDTREKDWSEKPPLRAKYKRSCREIHNAAELKATLRAGEYAWPGGYQMYFIMSDGEALSFDSARKELRNLLFAFSAMYYEQWLIVGCEINYEDQQLFCCHSGERIPPAYGEE